MKKNYLNILVILTVLIMSVGFASCSDDDGLDSPVAQEVIGTWYSSDTSINMYCTITFYSDGTGDFESEYHGKYKSASHKTTGVFTWSCSGNTIKTIGEYVIIDYNDGSVDTDTDFEVNYIYNGTTLKGGRYSGAASIYTKEGYNPYDSNNEYEKKLVNTTWKSSEPRGGSITFSSGYYFSIDGMTYPKGEQVGRCYGQWNISDNELHLYPDADIDAETKGATVVMYPLIYAQIIKLTDYELQLENVSGKIFIYSRSF